MKIKKSAFFLSFIAVVYASVYIPSSETSSGQMFNSMVDIYDYLYSVIRSVCILSGVFLLVGGIYYYSQYRKDPVYMPFTKVLTMFFCAACALGLAFIPGVNLQ
jgi:hypothetical protein